MLYAIVTVLVLILDQGLKYWTTVNITLNVGSRPLIGGVISLVNIHNTGAAFGFLSKAAAARWVFVIIAVLFVAFVVFALMKNLIRAPLGRWSAVLVMAGAVGNCIDRVMQGYVVDMFKLEFLNFAIFNLADIFITVCGILFCVYIIFGKEDGGERQKQPAVSKKHAAAPRGGKRSRRLPDEDEDVRNYTPGASRAGSRFAELDDLSETARSRAVRDFGATTRRGAVRDDFAGTARRSAVHDELTATARLRAIRDDPAVTGRHPVVQQPAASAAPRSAEPVRVPPKYTADEIAAARAGMKNTDPMRYSGAAEPAQRPAPARPAQPGQPEQRQPAPARSPAPAAPKKDPMEFTLDDILAEYSDK